MDTFKVLCNMDDMDLRSSQEFVMEYTQRTGHIPSTNVDILRRDATAITLVEEKGGQWCFFNRIKVYQIPQIFEPCYTVDVVTCEPMGYPAREAICIDYEAAYRNAIRDFLSTGDRASLESRYAEINEGKVAFAKLNYGRRPHPSQ